MMSRYINMREGGELYEIVRIEVLFVQLTQVCLDRYVLTTENQANASVILFEYHLYITICE